MNGSIYWALRDFAVSPGWTGGAALPLGYDTDGVNHKGLIGYDGTEKPAFAVAEQLFGQTPSFVR
jgi:beta-glucuronidase